MINDIFDDEDSDSEEPESTSIVRRGPGAMGKAERRLKQELFAGMLLDPHVKSTKAEIMERVGISENTYYQWSRDPNLPRLAGYDLNVTDVKVRILASTMKAQALMNLQEVMNNDKNGLARVRAAEIILAQNTEAIEAPSAGDKKIVEDIMRRFQPILVLGNTQIYTQPQEQGEEEEEGFIELS